MQAQPGVQRVLHPALSSSPGHETWRRDASGAASLFTVVFDDAIPAQRIEAFCDALQLFRLGYSWAGPVSLCVPYERAEMRGRNWPHAHGPVRFAVGLESVADLRADLAQALRVLDA
jgi:cystathionine beta-lyase